MVNGELDKGRKDVAERLAHLLSESLLDDQIKTTLLDNLDKLPDHALMGLMDSLEQERESIATLASDLEFMGNQRDKQWGELEAQQRRAAEEVIDEFLNQKEKEFKVEEAKQSL